MSESQVTAFLQYLRGHADAAAAARGKNATQLVAEAKENGFDVTEQEMQQVIDSFSNKPGPGGPVPAINWNAPI